MLQLATTEFAFAPDLHRDVREELRIASLNFLRGHENNKQTNVKEIIFVSVHVRRTDYVEWLSYFVGGQLVSSRYFTEAMNIFRRKYNTNTTEVLFVMASDDIQWCKDKFGNVNDVVLTASFTSMSSSKQPTFDMAVMAQCNHSIFRY